MFKQPGSVFPKVLNKRPEGLPLFKWTDVKKLEDIGSGSYSDVAVYGYGATKQKVAVKTFKSNVPKNLLEKEVKLLSGLDHCNVVKALAFSANNPNALMLQYCTFDMKPFTDDNVKVSTLSELLLILDECDFAQFHGLQIHAASGLINGLAYLHGKGVVHRDLKPANVLVSNQDYVDLFDSNRDRFMQCWNDRPVTVKLTDFGESRSALIQTNSLVQTATTNAYRGSPAFMSPEILAPLYREDVHIGPISLEDMKASDVWSLALIFHNLLSPDLR